MNVVLSRTEQFQGLCMKATGDARKLKGTRTHGHSLSAWGSGYFGGVAASFKRRSMNVMLSRTEQFHGLCMNGTVDRRKLRRDEKGLV